MFQIFSQFVLQRSPENTFYTRRSFLCFIHKFGLFHLYIKSLHSNLTEDTKCFLGTKTDKFLRYVLVITYRLVRFQSVELRVYSRNFVPVANHRQKYPPAVIPVSMMHFYFDICVLRRNGFYFSFLYQAVKL